jgi:hypothetical protein
MNAVFGNSAAASPAATGQPSATAQTTGASPSPSAGAATTTGAATGAPTANTSAASVDVGPMLDEAVARKKEKLSWRTSIVDLMKALDIDSSLTARKELAKELGYSGDTGDSATMNIWLHKQVIAKIAANGGRLPDDLKT